MPRTLDKKVIKTRIKKNKFTMKRHRASVVTAMKAAEQGEEVNQKIVRSNLSTFLKAAALINADNTKLDILKERGE